VYRHHKCGTIRDEMDAKQFHRISRALADPTRMQILEGIAASKEMACAILNHKCDVSQPTISHHLKELSAAGLIKSRRQAKSHFFRLDRKLWAAYLAEMRRRIPAVRRNN
jgi:ArsR family transcriptional regulator